MEYVGSVWFSEEVGGYVKCVKDNCLSCGLCVFSEDQQYGLPCTPKSYNTHPCYQSDREDGQDVHFEKASEEDVIVALNIKAGDKVLWADKRTLFGQEETWEVREVLTNNLIKISTGNQGVFGYCEVEVPVMEIIKLEG